MVMDSRNQSHLTFYMFELGCWKRVDSLFSKHRADIGEVYLTALVCFLTRLEKILNMRIFF